MSFGILHKGIPMNYQKDNKNPTPTFSYFHESTESFTIELKEDNGFAHLLANALDQSETQTMSEHLPSQGKADYSSYTQPDWLKILVKNTS